MIVSHRILIVDDAEGFPETGALVDCLSDPEEAKRLPRENYDCIFVHRRPAWLEDWAVENFEHVFFFSGEAEMVEILEDGIISIGRTHLKKYFQDFEEAYSKLDTGIPEAPVAIFSGAAKTGASGMKTASGIDAINARGESINVPLYRNEGGALDASRILEELNDHYPFVHLQLSDTFAPERPFEGLDFLIDLRLRSELEVSRCAVLLNSNLSMKDVLASSVNRAIVMRSTSQQDDELAPLSDDELLSLIEEFRFEEPAGRHKLANLWGPIRLWQGWMSQCPRKHALSLYADWPSALLDVIQCHRYYVQQLSIGHLRSKEDDDSSGASRAYKRWDAFLNDRYSERPLRLWLLDDEAESGWKQAVESLFRGRPGSLDLFTPSMDELFGGEEIAKTLSESPPDLILCDLRLFEKEDVSLQRIQDVSGLKLIRFLKNEHPNIPVIAFTASNKFWSAEAAAQSGADGYWVKENPTLGIDESYSKENAAQLTKTFIDVLTTRQETKVIYDLHVLMNVLASNERFEEVQSHLKVIAAKTLRAYWFLTRRQSQHDDLYGMQHENMAFLELWSVINEFDSLFYQIPNSERVGGGMNPDLMFYNCRVRSPKSMSWSLYVRAKSQECGTWTAPSGLSYPSQKIRKRILPQCARPNEVSLFHAANLDFQTFRTEWLLEIDECSSGQYDTFRRIRNKLPQEHGSSTSQQNACLNDVQELAQYWFDFLSPLQEQ